MVLAHVLFPRLRCKVSMNGSPIEDKVDMLNSTMSTPANINDRLFAIDNRVCLLTNNLYR